MCEKNRVRTTRYFSVSSPLPLPHTHTHTKKTSDPSDLSSNMSLSSTTSTSVKKEKEGDGISDPPRVIFAVFCGRRRYLQCLFPYIEKLVARRVVTDVHLWDFTSNAADASFIRDACVGKTRDCWCVMDAPPCTDAKTRALAWLEFYRHYGDTMRDDDVLIKCDDDIVYVSTNSFPGLVRHARALDCVVYPNITNSEVSAAVDVFEEKHSILKMEQARAMFPTTTREPVFPDWHTKPEYAVKVLRWFCEESPYRHGDGKVSVRDERKYAIRGRVTLCMAAFGGRCAKQLFPDYVKQYGERGRVGDEVYFSFTACTKFDRPNYIFPTTRAVHFAFVHQRNGTPALDLAFLPYFYALANMGFMEAVDRRLRAVFCEQRKMLWIKKWGGGMTQGVVPCPTAKVLYYYNNGIVSAVHEMDGDAKKNDLMSVPCKTLTDACAIFHNFVSCDLLMDAMERGGAIPPLKE